MKTKVSLTICAAIIAFASSMVYSQEIRTPKFDIDKSLLDHLYTFDRMNRNTPSKICLQLSNDQKALSRDQKAYETKLALTAWLYKSGAPNFDVLNNLEVLFDCNRKAQRRSLLQTTVPSASDAKKNKVL